MSANIHPFPARMAPELALQSLKNQPLKGVILDPMAGSGMVLRQASDLGIPAVGFDMDPLAVLMSKVWTQYVPDKIIEKIYNKCLNIVSTTSQFEVFLPWIDKEPTTNDFIKYWFGGKQIKELRLWAFAFYLLNNELVNEDEIAALNVIKICLSRIIITKEQCASLARDTSHSRPHRVVTESDYSVHLGMQKSVSLVRKRLCNYPPRGGVTVNTGDARSLSLPDESIAGVLTSPPYLNAIDYMRGHRLSLVWLGYTVLELRAVRSNSIGAERAPDIAADMLEFRKSFGNIDELPQKYISMIDRYAIDLIKMMSEIKRVLIPKGKATFVVGNSCLKGVFIYNSQAVAKAAELVGLSFLESYERDLPSSS
ncbi:hypothetical protein R2308_004280, partial [Cronobacter turicensis]|nr:hypothetical protein [Cronobacter turicensis]